MGIRRRLADFRSRRKKEARNGQEQQSDSETTSLVSLSTAVANCDLQRIAIHGRLPESHTDRRVNLTLLKCVAKVLVSRRLSNNNCSQIGPTVPSLPCQEHFPKVQIVLDDDLEADPKDAYLSLSSDLRLRLDSPKVKTPSSLVSFRSPDHHFKLTRMEQCPDDTVENQTPLRQIVESRVALTKHRHGPAIRISEGKKIIHILVKDEKKRLELFSVLKLRIGPRSAILHQLKEEIRFFRDAVSGMIKMDAGSGDETVGKEERRLSLASRLWKTIGPLAHTLNWTSNIGQAIAGVSAELEKLAKVFCPIGIAGSVFTVIWVFAGIANLLATERNGRSKLEETRKTLHDTSRLLFECLVQILLTGFPDDELIKEVFSVIEECWAEAARLEQYLFKPWVKRVWKAGDVEKIMKSVAGLRLKLFPVRVLKIVATGSEEVKEEVKELKRQVDVLEQAAAKEVFQPVDLDPVRISSEGLLSEVSKTVINQVKNLVLSSKTFASSAPDAATQESKLCATLAIISGEIGVGKTSLCKLLCTDRDVRKQFPEGAILWMSLGPRVSDDKVKQEIARVVGDHGGRRTAEKIRRAASVKVAIDYAREFFNAHRILLVVDNVWKPARGSDVTDWTKELPRIAACPGSLVLMTTRFQDLCSGPHVYHIPLDLLNVDGEDDMDRDIANELYDTHFLKCLKQETSEKQSEGQSRGYPNTRQEALKISLGLPLAITSIGAYIRQSGDTADGVVSMIYRTKEEGGLAASWFGEAISSAVDHSGIFAAMSDTLDFLDKYESGNDIFKIYQDYAGRGDQQFSASYLQFENKPVTARYAALEAMEYSKKMPFSDLACLWHLKSPEHAKQLCSLLENVRLGRISHRDNSFVLHDLQYSFCCAAARKYAVNGHLLLISGCIPCMGENQDWASFCFSYRRIGSQIDVHSDSLGTHMGEDLFRHLCKASIADDGLNATRIAEVMIDLLTNFRWLRGRGAAHGRGGVVFDFKMALSACVRGSYAFSSHLRREQGLISGKTRESIVLIRRIVELTPEHAFKNHDYRNELATQIVGRIHQALIGGWNPNVDIACVQKLMRSAEKNVSQSWLRPFSGCFPCPSNRKCLLKEITVGRGEHPVSCVAPLGDGIHVVSLSSGDIRINNVETSETVLALGSGKDIFVAAIATTSENSYLVFSGALGVCVTSVEKGIDGKLQEIDRRILDPREVANMAVSQDGSRIVAVFSETNTVSVWTRSDDGNRICYTPAAPFHCERKVSHLTMSPEGDVIASAHGNEILFWQARDAIMSFAPTDRITSIAFSKDAQSLIVGTRLGVVQVWSVLSKSCAKQMELRGECVRFLEVLETVIPGGNPENACDLLVVGADNSVKVFDLKELNFLGECPLSSQPSSICISTTLEGKRLMIVGCSDACLSIMDVVDVVEMAVPDSGRRQLTGSPIECVDVSPVRGIILSGHENGMLCKWDMESGRPLHAFAHKHDMRVTCICVSGDEEIAVSGSVDGSVQVWDIAFSTLRFALEEQLGAIVYVNITSDGRSIVTCTNKGWVQVWNGATPGPRFCLFAASGRPQVDLTDSGSGAMLANSVGRNTLFDKLCKMRIDRYLDCFLRDSMARPQWDTLLSQLSPSVQTETAPSRTRRKAILGSARTWVITAQGRTLWCIRKFADGESGAKKMINFNRNIDDVIVQPKPSVSGSEEVIIVVALEGQQTPAILHLPVIRPKTENGTVLQSLERSNQYNR